MNWLVINKMSKFIESIIGQVLPSIPMHKANVKLKEKIDCEEIQRNRAHMDYFAEIPIEVFRQKYAEAFEVKRGCGRFLGLLN